MQIKEVCECCCLTKKAIEYYEAKGLLQPAIRRNGYRDYGEQEITALKEISVLRRCGIPVAAIKEMMESTHKAATLEKYSYITGIRMERMHEEQACMDGLLRDYDVNSAFECIKKQARGMDTIKERLVFAFPGSYGLLLAMHFGRFLNGAIDTEEKQMAYRAIVQYLDEAEIYISPELADFLEEMTASHDKTSMEEWQAGLHTGMMSAVEDPEAYAEQNAEKIERYLAFRNSDAFWQSTAGQMQRSLLEFQEKSGYRENFIVHMETLSPLYSEYMRQLTRANEKFMQMFPSSKNLYET